MNVECVNCFNSFETRNQRRERCDACRKALKKHGKRERAIEKSRVKRENTPSYFCEVCNSQTFLFKGGGVWPDQNKCQLCQGKFQTNCMCCNQSFWTRSRGLGIGHWPYYPCMTSFGPYICDGCVGQQTLEASTLLGQPIPGKQIVVVYDEDMYPDDLYHSPEYTEVTRTKNVYTGMKIKGDTIESPYLEFYNVPGSYIKSTTIISN